MLLATEYADVLSTGTESVVRLLFKAFGLLWTVG